MSKLILLSYLILSYTISLKAQIKTGVVIDSIWCAHTGSQSYAAFLPSNYSSDSKWPIIYFFDPDASGSDPVKKYAKVANELGYIIVCSNNSRNGPIHDSYIAADAVFQDTENRFSIDHDKIYTSGFSGGSRLALAIAINTNQIAGVFGVGATEPITPDISTLIKPGFRYVGLVGILDKNYDEHKLFKRKLIALGIPNILITSSIDHEWASSDDFRLGMLWMEQKRNRKELFMDAIENKLVRSKDSIPINDKYELAKLGDKAGSEQLLPIDPKEYKKSVRGEDKLLKKEYGLKKQLFDSIRFLLSLERVEKRTLDWIQNRTKQIQKMKEKSKSFEIRAMYHRVITATRGGAFEGARLDIPQKRFERALVGMEIYNAMTKNALTTNWWKSKIYSLLGRTKESLACIEIMLQQGFKRTDLFLSNPEFENVRNTKIFNELLEKYKSSN
jgi:hypothetical protein